MAHGGARGTPLGYSMHIHCTEGMLEANLAESKIYLHSKLENEEANMNTGSQTELLFEGERDGKLTSLEIRHFLECILHGTTPLTNGPDSLQGLRVIWKLYEAERNGQVADLRGLGINST